MNMLSDLDKKKIIENNKVISELLKENETIFRNANYKPPITNFALDRIEKISFPAGYIRTVDSFKQRYHLGEICLKRETRQNIAYALEVSDLINFILNRVNIWGSVETILFKLAIVNLVSVMEAIVLEATNNICQHANKCNKTNDCNKHFSKTARNYARGAVEELVEKDILNFDEDELRRVLTIIDLRNRIHIRLVKGNELNQADFNLNLYNEVIKLLQNIDEQIYQKAVPLYECQC